MDFSTEMNDEENAINALSNRNVEKHEKSLLNKDFSC